MKIYVVYKIEPKVKEHVEDFFTREEAVAFCENKRWEIKGAGLVIDEEIADEVEE